jgi:deoxyribonuclease-4
MSVAGGLDRAIDRIMAVKGEALQIFSRNQRQWRVAPLKEREANDFRQARVKWGPQLPVAIHNSYLVNLAASDRQIVEKSIASMIEEFFRARRLGIKFIIMHPGSHRGSGIETGLNRLVRGIDTVYEKTGATGQIMLLLETTAGQGTSLGSRFEELAYVLDRARYARDLGICLDTCHIFAAGYDIGTPAAYAETMELFARRIGMKHLHFFHLNDSKAELGSRKDRHEHIGRGQIGVAGFRLLLNDERFAHHPMVLETPKKTDLKEDVENLSILRNLLSKKSPWNMAG